MDTNPVADSGRALAVEFAGGGGLQAKKSVNVSGPLLDLMASWQRQARAQVKRPTLSALIEASLVDLPLEIDGLEALGAQIAPQLLVGGPRQLGLRLREETVRRIEDAQFELSTVRGRATVPLWHCVCAAVVRQLRAEGLQTGLPE